MQDKESDVTALDVPGVKLNKKKKEHLDSRDKDFVWGFLGDNIMAWCEVVSEFEVQSSQGGLHRSSEHSKKGKN